MSKGWHPLTPKGTTLFLCASILMKTFIPLPMFKAVLASIERYASIKGVRRG